jgi:AraC-like DNA-binding protein
VLTVALPPQLQKNVPFETTNDGERAARGYNRREMGPRNTRNPTHDSEHTVPISLAAQLVDLVQRWRVPPEKLLVGSGLTQAALDDVLGRLPVATMSALLARARLLTAEPGLGYYLALQKRVSTFGYLGFVASSAPNVGKALELAIKYAPLFSTALSIELRTEGRVAYLRLNENADLGSSRDIVMISMMLGLETIAGALTGAERRGAADIMIPEPSYNARFRHLVPKWRFGQRANRVLIDPVLLEAPIVSADPVSFRLARAMCERAFDELGFDGGFVDKVRGNIARERGFCSLEDVAEQMHLSPRTLKRRLAEQGVSFSELAQHERQDRALALLRSSRLSVDEVAQRLDYAYASTFVRAFRRWTGTTPSAYRKAHLKRRPSSHG